MPRARITYTMAGSHPPSAAGAHESRQASAPKDYQNQKASPPLRLRVRLLLSSAAMAFILGRRTLEVSLNESLESSIISRASLALSRFLVLALVATIVSADSFPGMEMGDTPEWKNNIFPEILRDEAVTRLKELGKVSDANGYLERTFLSPASVRAASLIRSWMENAGLETWLDQMGNVHGRVDGVNATAEVLLIGSHLDTVIDAGIFDGSLGIVCAISALKVLKMNGNLEKLNRPVEVIAFSDEEGVRFQSTFLGSAAIAGALPVSALNITDKSGLSMQDVLKVNSIDIMEDDLFQLKYDPRSVWGYVEVHIEQGPVLEMLGVPFGVVKGIAGQTRLKVDDAEEKLDKKLRERVYAKLKRTCIKYHKTISRSTIIGQNNMDIYIKPVPKLIDSSDKVLLMKVTVKGSQGHAGTVPMYMRQDPMAAAAELIVLLESLCKHPENFMSYDDQCNGLSADSLSGSLVCTVGEISCWPSASNVIPGQVTFTIDLRAIDDMEREAIIFELSKQMRLICERRSVSCFVERKHDAEAVICDTGVSSQLKSAASIALKRMQGDVPVEVPMLISGAGHDAMAMSHLTKVGMLFIRCRGGISHSPAEHVLDDDIWAAGLAILAFLDQHVNKHT